MKHTVGEAAGALVWAVYLPTLGPPSPGTLGLPQPPLHWVFRPHCVLNLPFPLCAGSPSAPALDFTPLAFAV